MLRVNQEFHYYVQVQVTRYQCEEHYIPNAETEEETKSHREKVRLTMKRKREAETEEKTKWHKQKNKLAKRRYRQAEKKHCHSETEEHKDDMEDVISRSKKEALKFLHRIKDPKNPHKHRAIVCIICDRCIIGT